MSFSFPLQVNLARSPASYTKQMNSLVSEFGQLERLTYASELHHELHAAQLLSPLERLCAYSSRPIFPQDGVYQQHPLLTPSHIDKMMADGWNLKDDDAFPNLPLNTQQLMLQYAMWTRKMVPTHPTIGATVHDVLYVLNDSPLALRDDPFLQQMMAAQNAPLFLAFFELGHYTKMDSDAMALGFQHHKNITPAWYDLMTPDTFTRLIALPDFFDKHVKNLAHTCQHHALEHLSYLHHMLSFPKNKMEVLLEHNPMLYLQSVILNDNVRNGEFHVKQWFEPMFNRALELCSSNPLNIRYLLSPLGTPRGPKWYDRTFKKYAPEAYAFLPVCRSMHSTDAQGTYDAYTMWVQGLIAQRTIPKEHIELPEMEPPEY